jgi:uncharacterized protein
MTLGETINSIRGRTGWIISDGKTGNVVQMLGVFDALGLDYAVKDVAPSGLHKMLSPWFGVARSERFALPDVSPFAPPFPDFAIATGRLTTPYLRELKRRAGESTFTIVLQDPKVPLSTADLFCVPEHDKLRGTNVFTTLTAPHSFTERRLAQLRQTMPPEIAALPSPRVAVMLGGSNGDYTYTDAALDRLATALRALSSMGVGLMITPSRRTEPAIVARARAATRHAPCLFWSMEGDNPYPMFLAHADAFVSPADSVNMTGEPCATGRPVYVFYPDGGSAKFDRFHAALERSGATRPLPTPLTHIETWDYEPLNSAEVIAAEVVRRWSAVR